MENQLFLKVSFYQIAVCLILSVGTLCFNSGRLKISLNVPYPCKLSYAACTRYNLVFSWWLSVIIIYLFWLLWLVKVKEALTSGMDGGLKHVLTHLSLTLTSCPLRSWSSGTSVAMQRVPGQVPVIVGWLLFSHDNLWFHSTESHFLKLFLFPASGAVLTSTSLPSGMPSSFSLLLFWLSVMARVIQILISWYRHWYPLESALVATDTSLLVLALLSPHKPHVCFLGCAGEHVLHHPQVWARGLCEGFTLVFMCF